MPCTGRPLGRLVQGRKSKYLNKTKMAIKFHYVYILRSLKDRLFYIGYSDDLRQQVIDHNKGKKIPQPKIAGHWN